MNEIKIDPAVLQALADAGLNPATVAHVVGRALAEDLADGPDITTLATIGADQRGTPTWCRARPASWPGCRWPRSCSRSPVRDG